MPIDCCKREFVKIALLLLVYVAQLPSKVKQRKQIKAKCCEQKQEDKDFFYTQIYRAEDERTVMAKSDINSKWQQSVAKRHNRI